MSASDQPFHALFKNPDDIDPPSSWNRANVMVSKLMFPALGASMRFLTTGPNHPQWSFTYHVAVRTMKHYLVDLSLQETPNVEAVQKGTSDPSKLPKEAHIETILVSPNDKVKTYLKQHAPGEWPDPANSRSMIECEWVSAPDANPNHVIYLIHGGLYVMGSAKMYRASAYRIALKTKCRVCSVNYRLAPQNPYPCALIDAMSGYLHLLKTYPSENIVLMGDSAGGGLVLACLLLLRDMRLEMPRAGYCQSPWCDLTHSFPSWTSNYDLDYLPLKGADTRLSNRQHYYCPDSYLKNKYVSPIFETDFGGLPPLFIQVGRAEMLRDEIVALADKVAKQGSVTLEIYDFQSAAVAAVSRAADWIQIQLSNGGDDTRVKIELDYDGVFLDQSVL